MSRNYDNWERLVAAVIKREEIWELCHQHSRSPSICSEASSSDFSSSFRLSDAKLEDKEESAQNPIPRLVLVEGSFTSGGRLGKGRFGDSIFIELRRGIPISDHEFLACGTQLVMKKLVGEVKVTEEEFKMVFGNCRHENVAAPRGYYFSNNKNYVFSDYHSQRSLHDLLHYGILGFVPAPLWGGRLKIAIGAARGIAHIHKQCGGKLAHGNIKSSNIFLNSQEYGLVSDFGLSGIMRISGKQGCLGYHASEYEFKNASHESDVYSFGVLLLELLTGRSPLWPHGPQKNLHLVAWALSVAPKDWSSKLFDRRIRGTVLLVDEVDRCEVAEERYSDVSGISFSDSMEVEKVEMLEVATRCLAMLPVDRPKMFEVVLMLEKITWKHALQD
ncbi:hypothetical protein ACS0TY_004711 [Phlomoides rotata]